MASPFLQNLPILLLLLNLCSARAYDPTPLLIQTCNQTPTPEFCIETLGSDDRAPIADIKLLCHISMEWELSWAAENEDFIAASLENTTDPQLKQELQHCSINYGGTVYALSESMGFVIEGEWKKLGQYSGIASENTRDCERNFVEGPTHWSPMTEKNDRLKKLADITDVIIVLVLRSL